MKKIFSLFLVTIFTLGLSACAKSVQVGEFPELDESNIVEMSSSEMMNLFSTSDYTDVNSESVRISVKGDISIDIDNSEVGYEEGSTEITTFYDVKQIDLNLNSVLYLNVSDQISDVRMHMENTFNLHYSSNYTGFYSNNIVDFNANGEVGVYFSSPYIYVRSDVTGTYNDEAIDGVFKEKYDQEWTQELWDEIYGITEFINYPNSLNSMYGSEILGIMNDVDIENIIKVIPNLKVYKDGTTYSIAFSINKEDLMSSFMDIWIALALEMNGTLPSSNELDEIEKRYIEEINGMMEQLELECVITIEKGRIAQIALDMVFVTSKQSANGGVDFDIEMIIDFGVKVPKNPNDLDEYNAVSAIGREFTDSIITS